MSHGLDGQVAIVTGGGGGIGTHIVARLTAAGARVVVSGRTQAKLDAVVEQVAQTGGTATAIVCDITDESQVADLVAGTVAEYGRLDVMVNNAGGGSAMRKPEDTPVDEFRDIVDKNLTGTFLCSIAAGRRMIEQGDGGRIINISSIAGTKGNPGMLHYSAAKAGVISLTTNLARMWAGHGIRVNCIAPGMIATEAMIGWGVIPAATDDDGNPVPDLYRTPGPEHVADLTLFLASDASAMITGELVPIRSHFKLDR